jgi:NAD+ diphosphatase
MMRYEPNVFAGGWLDRSEAGRRDAEWLERASGANGARAVPVWQSHSLVSLDTPPAAVLPPLASCESLLEESACAVLLGDFNGHSYVAIDLAAPHLVQHAGIGGEFVNLHTIGSRLEPWESALLAYARGILYWHSRNLYCGLCGNAMAIAQAGHLRLCTRADCGTHHFPRTDPAVIVLVTDGDCCLLGRNANWEPGKYSTIAGFVEPGESLEDAVYREVWEETGVRVEDARYHSSQPWPFPSSLMIGFTATATSQQIQVDENELESAHWFTRAQLRAGVEAGTLLLPSDVSIARRLVVDWLEADLER